MHFIKINSDTWRSVRIKSFNGPGRTSFIYEIRCMADGHTPILLFDDKVYGEPAELFSASRPYKTLEGAKGWCRKTSSEIAGAFRAFAKGGQ